ncbi:DUF4249 domain-containing protein [Aquiflexum sp. LQ15W]|uniref:DUF4249 domain-containing protein n=1 Tax=Cognataquiflexum nitidum TaxID=2922272 RepID=UPI001F14946C|nr:DUF4249 domain-containing protein [Cognataquiflexum nitidum]MCH6198078.1 DUF4249 domain-containing protein [Cognataquiflexum nitidum]
MLKRLIYILLLFPISCIEPYRVELPEGEQLLTVDGFVTTEPGPHNIRLTRSDTYGSVFEGLIRPVSQASVAIRDSEGNVVFLTESEERGVYQTPADFQARVGISYSLLIELQGGKSYTSLPEMVNSVPEIEALTYRAIEVKTANRLQDKIGVQIFTQFRDPSDQTNFYYWRQGRGSYVLVANPELFTLPPDHPTNPRGSAPKDCCSTCFLQEQSRIQTFSLASDLDFNGLRQNIPIAFIEDDGLRFKSTYRAEILQMSVSREAHRFLRLIEQQISLTGSVFDQPPANIRGNMISLDDPDETVLGFFIAASVSKKEVFIQRNNLEFTQTPKVIADDCLTVRGATLDPPAGWNIDD